MKSLTSLTIKFDDTSLATLRAIAEIENRSVAYLVREAITLWLVTAAEHGRVPAVTPTPTVIEVVPTVPAASLPVAESKSERIQINASMSEAEQAEAIRRILTGAAK
jgi:hypothetical protein